MESSIASPALAFAMMPPSVSTESALLILGVAVGFCVMFAIVAQYLELTSSLSWDKFFLTPYLKFAYVSFLKPHTGDAQGGQQSALESFYAAQVGTIGQLAAELTNQGFDI